MTIGVSIGETMFFRKIWDFNKLDKESKIKYKGYSTFSAKGWLVSLPSIEITRITNKPDRGKVDSWSLSIGLFIIGITFYYSKSVI